MVKMKINISKKYITTLHNTEFIATTTRIATPQHINIIKIYKYCN